jgi:hypothetical protein
LEHCALIGQRTSGAGWKMTDGHLTFTEMSTILHKKGTELKSEAEHHIREIGQCHLKQIQVNEFQQNWLRPPQNWLRP